MKRTYTCPKCQSILNPNVKIILTAIVKKMRGMILFSPNPGNYTAILPKDITPKKGDKVEFRCPVCGVELTSKINENLAEINFHLENGLEGKVKFSRLYGEQATYFVTDENVRSYGENAGAYGNMNFFGESLDED